MPVKVKQKIIDLLIYTKNIKNKKENNFRQKEYNRLKNKCTNGKIKLHFGCGPRVLKGWINIDLNFEPYKDYLKYYGDEYYPESMRGNKDDFYAVDILRTGLPFPDNSVDTIFHEDFIEHLNQKDQIIFLSETFRVMKSSGVQRINTPDLLKAMKRSSFSKGSSGVYIKEWNDNGHANLLTKEYTKEIAEMIGYKKVIFGTKNFSVSNEIPKEYRPDPRDREIDENIFVDLIK